MKLFASLTVAMGALLALSEMGRWWGDPRFFPLALDEMTLGLAMIIAGTTVRTYGPAILAAAWAGFSGFILCLLVPTTEHLIHGPPKESAIFYTAILGVAFIIGLIATVVALKQARHQVQTPSL